jgi:acyl-coenzyme A thioesterase PaaI-like protein
MHAMSPVDPYCERRCRDSFARLLAPARGPELSFEASVTKAGRTISVVDARTISDGDIA